MSDFEQRVHHLDVSLFEKIDSQSTCEDRRSLLAIQRAVRNERGDFVYLEIGSHLGGSLQTHYVDPKCRFMYSIDKRPLVQPDQRAIDFEYEGNSTERMLSNLRSTYPDVVEHLLMFDDDAKNIDREMIEHAPDLCFIDGEHTNEAVVSDFRFCIDVASPNAVICFHDANLVFGGLTEIKAFLRRESVEFSSLKLGGTVYVILLREASERFHSELSKFAIDEAAFFATSRRSLGFVRMMNRCRGWFGGLLKQRREQERIEYQK